MWAAEENESVRVIQKYQSSSDNTSDAKTGMHDSVLSVSADSKRI
jgi:hypothetical protein